MFASGAFISSILQSYCYKLIQRLRVTCFLAGQYNTGLVWHITGIILQYYILWRSSQVKPTISNDINKQQDSGFNSLLNTEEFDSNTLVKY